MTEKEIKFLTEKMKSCSTYLEYGSGNSTRIASSLENIKTITVVESSRDFWNELVESDTNIGCGLASGRVDVYSPYLGETINWGHFKGAEKSHLWPLYSMLPYDRVPQYELVLIDGRFRVACILLALLNGCNNILVHDYTLRPKYAVVEKYTDLEHTVDTLVSLKRKSGISDKKIQTELIKFIYEPTDSLPHQRKIKRIVEVTLGKSNLTKIKNKVGKVLAKR